MKFQQFSSDDINHVVPGQRAIQDKLLGLDATNGAESETVTSGTLSATMPVSYLSVTGTQAYTLADGIFPGQEKVVQCTVAASTPVGTLTITTPETTTGMVVSATHVFNTVGQAIHFVWSGTKWRIHRTRRAGVTVPVIGTTVLTGFTLNANYSTSVTGTVSSTGTKAIPDGQYPGDLCYVGCSVAASTPIGNINFTGLTLANVAATDLQAIGALTDTVTLQWTGTAWLVTANSGITVA